MRIRHYGILSCFSKKGKMTLCRNLLGCQQYISRLRGKSTAEKILILYKHDIRKCRCCGAPVTTFRVDGGIYAVLRYDNRIREKRSPAGGLFVMQKKNIRFDCGVQQTSSKVQDSSVVDESMIIKIHR